MTTLKEWHTRSIAEKWAMPHFNFSNLEQLHALVEAAREAQSPLVLGLSEGERDAVGLAEAVALVSVARADGYPIFLNADHSRSPETAKAAVDAGFDSVHIDLSKESYEENIAGTKEVVEYAKAKNADIEVEGELGYLATESSKVYKEEVVIPEDSYTQPEQAIEYVAKTGVDRFASAIGNLHGIAANEPKLRFELVE
ncbi:MAG: class II fructose-bisphosphate aldolase, partial [Candidatus Spechtbacterales bacterium]